jgi:hypothetical protein
LSEENGLYEPGWVLDGESWRYSPVKRDRPPAFNDRLRRGSVVLIGTFDGKQTIGILEWIDTDYLLGSPRSVENWAMLPPEPGVYACSIRHIFADWVADEDSLREAYPELVATYRAYAERPGEASG